MRFLADMGVSITTVHALREAGHDAVHLREEGLIRLPDPDIVAKAAQEHRVVLTFDLDFETFSPWRAPKRLALSFFVCGIRRPPPTAKGNWQVVRSSSSRTRDIASGDYPLAAEKARSSTPGRMRALRISIGCDTD